GTGENANKVTINKTVVTANPAATTAEYTYTFDNWINGTATVTGSGLTITANFTRTVRTYDITFKNADGTTLKKSDGTTDAVYSVAYGETPAYDGAIPTKTADDAYTYTFNGWDNEIVAVTEDATYTATYSTTKVQYTLTWDVNGGNALTGTYTNGTIDWGTAITKPADPTKAGHTFTGWDANNDGTADKVAATMPTSDVTYKALWTAASSDITLCENCENTHYNNFKATYGGSAGVGVNVTYPRQFAEGRWSTMCLPFNLDLAALITHKMYGRVYEFKYATGNANVGEGVNLYFSNAKSIEAGTCYIVNANAELADKTSFVFIGVTIDLSKDNGVALDSEDAYNDLPGDNSQGTIELVGTLRNGTLQGSATGNKYMGLKENKIYYPNTTAPGSTIWAYRGIFRSSEILDKESMQKMRIIVDGEDRGELILDADGDILAPSDAQSRKFIENGVLYIEREGVIYDAQGKRIK
ncbi:MAG: InlB B-repeat-containing protein, partial [Paludibacteraceae bacterium]|nr:InlB B-repeat-containing protein [Paludibacteraceae bacterium]